MLKNRYVRFTLKYLILVIIIFALGWNGEASTVELLVAFFCMYLMILSAMRWPWVWTGRRRPRPPKPLVEKEKEVLSKLEDKLLEAAKLIDGSYSVHKNPKMINTNNRFLSIKKELLQFSNHISKLKAVK